MKMFKKSVLVLLSAGMFLACGDDDDNGNIIEGDDDMPVADSRAELYTSSNNDGNITVYDVSDAAAVTTKTLLTASLDSEGIYYDPMTDEVTQASRSGLQLNTYADIFASTSGISLSAAISSTADLVSPRDIAVNGDLFVVADNADVDGDTSTDDGRFFIYTKTESGFTLRNTVTTNFAVWGIEFVGNTLYAVVDKTSDVAVFADFTATNTTDALVMPTKRITIEGIVRTHAIAETNGTMILTDIGEASGEGSDTDGGFHVINDFASKFDSVEDGGTLLIANNQVRVAGEGTFLGNPIGAEYDAENNIVFIAERANGGGRVLAFTGSEAGGNLTPVVNNELAGASSLYLYKE